MLRILYEKGLLYAFIAGAALAAAVEIQQGFHKDSPYIFYPIHLVLIIVIIGMMTYNWIALKISRVRYARDVIILICAYGMAVTGSNLAIYALPLLGIMAVIYFHYETRRDGQKRLKQQ